jgi:hypothetical protein
VRSDSKKPQSWCKKCIADGQCPVKKRAYNKAWRGANKDRRREQQVRYYKKLKHEVFYYYSSGAMCCACCGEAEIQFLSLDHINGGGNACRKKHGSGVQIYSKLRREGYPPGFQILCFNCNMAKGFWGSCPHKKKAS